MTTFSPERIYDSRRVLLVFQIIMILNMTWMKRVQGMVYVWLIIHIVTPFYIPILELPSAAVSAHFKEYLELCYSQDVFLCGRLCKMRTIQSRNLDDEAKN